MPTASMRAMADLANHRHRRSVAGLLLWQTFLAEHERWVLWLPVLMGLGIALYFGLSVEPPAGSGAAALGMSAVVTTLLARGRADRPAAWVCAVACTAATAGFAAAQFQASMPASRTLAAPVGPTPVHGRVAEVETFPDGQRVVLDRAVIVRDRGATGVRVRIRLRGNQPPLRLDDRITVTAMLVPPPGPAFPGAFDFQRQAYFDGLGAVGYSVGRATVTRAAGDRGSERAGEADDSDDSDENLFTAFAHLRFVVGERVRACLEGATAAVSLALLTGERRAIPDADITAIRDAGLAHLLSISGLHIGLVAGIVLFVVRGGLALVPSVALRFPVKKWAAAVSVLAAGAYTMLADAPVPSQRSFFMIAVVLLAMLVDRRGISMRLVAFAAAMVLLIQPEALLGPSFQMSFAAVVALLAAWEELALRRRRADAPPAVAAGPWPYVAGVLMTTLVATIATTPFAAYHFDRVQIYGLAANMAAVPLTSFWVMPWAVVAMVLMPFGLEPVGLIPMGWGVDGVLWIAREVASWPGSVVTLPHLATWGLALFTLGGCWLCLWRRRWRLLGLVVFALGCLGFLERPPDLLVDGRGRIAAIRDADGTVLFSARSGGRSTREAWLRRLGSDDTPGLWPEHGPSDGGLLRCDALGCVYRRGGHVVAVARQADALADDCRIADVLVSLVSFDGPCPSVRRLIDASDLARNGTHLVWLGASGVRIESVGADRGRRPWAPAPEQKAAKDTASDDEDD